MLHAAQIRVLVVDDEPAIVAQWTAALRRAGFIALGVLDAESAIDESSRFCPHVAVLDIGLPDTDGHALGVALRRANPSLRLIAATGDDTLRTGDRSLELGFDVHLIKPVRLADLRRVVKVLMIAASFNQGSAPRCDDEAG